MSDVFSFDGYNFQFFPFMRKAPDEHPGSESYVTVPPALWIVDGEKNRWTMGFMRPMRDPHRTGEYEFDVVKNGKPTGGTACRIEYRKGKIRIFGHEGWKTWNGKSFV